jgi:hypothetical protein
MRDGSLSGGRVRVVRILVKHPERRWGYFPAVVEGCGTN